MSTDKTDNPGENIVRSTRESIYPSCGSYPTSRENTYKEHDSLVKINLKNQVIKSNAFKNITYQVIFRVYKIVKYGETICVHGSIPELGKWKETKHHLKWTEGDIWESITPLSTNSFYFQYKYGVLQD